jgi:hypothetical protein
LWFSFAATWASECRRSNSTVVLAAADSPRSCSPVRCRAFKEHGDIKGAEEWFSRALGLDAKHVNALDMRGTARYCAGDIRAAAKDFEVRCLSTPLLGLIKLFAWLALAIACEEPSPLNGQRSRSHR